MTLFDFINTVINFLPDFDGKFENLSRFIDALDLLETIKGEYENIAISLIKIKLTQSIRCLLTNENSIVAIKNLLTATVKHEPPHSVIIKLLNFKQKNKSDNDFVKEIETLSSQLETSYIADGLSLSLAKQYSAQSAVKALKTNARSEEVKMLLRVGQFDSVNQAVTKFLELSLECTGEFQINYINSANIQSRYRKQGNNRNIKRNYNSTQRPRRIAYEDALKRSETDNQIMRQKIDESVIELKRLSLQIAHLQELLEKKNQDNIESIERVKMANDELENAKSEREDLKSKIMGMSKEIEELVLQNGNNTLKIQECKEETKIMKTKNQELKMNVEQINLLFQDRLYKIYTMGNLKRNELQITPESNGENVLQLEKSKKSKNKKTEVVPQEAVINII